MLNKKWTTDQIISLWQSAIGGIPIIITRWEDTERAYKDGDRGIEDYCTTRHFKASAGSLFRSVEIEVGGFVYLYYMPKYDDQPVIGISITEINLGNFVTTELEAFTLDSEFDIQSHVWSSFRLVPA